MRDMVRQVFSKGHIGHDVQAAWVLEMDVAANCGLPFVKVKSA